jgi:hypothetical protein
LHLAPSSETGMTYPGTREGLAQKVDTAAKEAARLSLTTALILRMAPLKIDRPDPAKLKVCQGTTRAASQTGQPKTARSGCALKRA